MAKPYSALEYDTTMAKLPYEEQIRVRAKIITELLKRDSNFLALPPGQRRLVLEKLIYRPPVFHDKALQNRVAQVGLMAVGADQKLAQMARQQMKAFIANAAFEQDGLLTKFGKAGVKYLSSTNIGNRKDMLEAWVGTEAYKKSPQYQKWQELTFMTDVTKFPGTPEDQDKAVAYFTYLGSQDKRIRNMLTMSKIAYPLIAQLTDLIPMYLGLAGTTLAPKGLGKLALKPFEKAFLAAKSPGALAGIHIGKEVAHGVATSSLWVAREMVRDLVNHKLPGDPDWGEMVTTNAKRFGEAFLFDVVANLAVGVVWPMTKSIGRSFKGWGNIQAYMKGLEYDQLTAHVKNTLLGRRTSMDVITQLPEKTQRAIKAGQAFRTVFDMVPTRNEKDLFKTVAMANHWIATDLPDGRWMLEFVSDTTSHTFRDLGAASKFMNQFMDGLRGDILAPGKKVIRDSILSGAAYDKVRLRKLIRGVLPSAQLENVDVLTTER